MQHLLSTELALLENELARKSEPSGPAVHLLQRHTQAAHVESQADCKHLEATVQAAQREHAAADAAVCTALQLAQQELREQQELLSASRQELLRSQEAARGTLLPPAAIVPWGATENRRVLSFGPTRSLALQARAGKELVRTQLPQEARIAAQLATGEVHHP